MDLADLFYDIRQHASEFATLYCVVNGEVMRLDDIQNMGYDEFIASEVTYTPDNYIKLDDEATEKVMSLIESLEDLEEIKNIRVDNYNHEWYLGINEDVNYCGLHKIFGCTMQPIREPFEFDDIIWAKYLLMFGFLIFGFMLVFWFGVNNYHEGVLQQSISGCTYGYLIMISLGMGFVLLVPFQIAFACLISPF